MYALLLQLLRRIKPDSLPAYVFATGLVAIAAVLRGVIGPFGPGVLPLLTFYPATLFAAFIGGFRPGVYAALLGGLIGWWAFFPPSSQVTLGEAASLFIYAATSLIIVWGADHHRSLIKRLRDEENFRQMVVQELGHRLKNKVATIQAIVGYQLRDNPEMRALINGRLSALSATDDLIMAAQGGGALLDDIVSTELSPYERSRAFVEGPKVMLNPKLALSMALVVHELATNAAKHGALSSPTGRISIRWLLPAQSADTNSSAPAILTMEWRESGGPAVSPPSNHGFGLRLLAVALAEFSGEIAPVFERSGFSCTLKVPLPPETIALRRQGQDRPPLASQPGHTLTPGHQFTA